MREFVLILPEIFLLVTVAFVLVGETSYHGERVRLLWQTALVGLGATFVQILLTYRLGADVAFSRALTIDGLALFLKSLIVCATAIAVVTASRSDEIPRTHQPEVVALLLAQAFAFGILVSASHFVLAFAAYALLQAIACYLLGYGRRSALSTEAAVKFYVFSLLSLLLLLYGAALLFAHVQTLNFYDVHRALASHPLERTQQIAIFMLLFMGLAMPLGVFPLHFWAPDSVQGAPTPVGSMVAFSLRAGAFGLLLRMAVIVFSEEAGAGAWRPLGAFDWTQVVAVVAGSSALAGALLAWKQTSARRMLAYFGLVQAGLGLLGLLVLDQVGFSSLLFGLTVEMLSLLAATAVLSRIARRTQSDRLKDLAGSIWISTPESALLIFALFSLLGAPASPGFVAKFSLVGAAFRHQHVALALVALVAWAVSLIAGARLCYALWGGAKRMMETGTAISTRPSILLSALGASLVGLFLFAEGLFQLTSRSLSLILW